MQHLHVRSERQEDVQGQGRLVQLHDRAQSQCFKCDPSLYEKVFVPMYVAKAGKKPERPPEAEFVDESKKKDSKTSA